MNAAMAREKVAGVGTNDRAMGAVLHAECCVVVLRATSPHLLYVKRHLSRRGVCGFSQFMLY
ncbi:hypothetical protein D9M68_53260 [compost metagenome]